MMKALCSDIDRSALEFTCEAVVTSGSAYNLQAVDEGTLDLGLSQGNLQYLASQGKSPFPRKYENIRTVTPLHQEIFVLAVQPESGISGIGDLKGKRLNIGNIGSGSRLITERLFHFLNWELSEFEVHSYKSSDLPESMCDKRIDAAIYSTGHPNEIYQHMLDRCAVKLVDLWDNNIARFVEAGWEYSPAAIPANTYPSEPADIHGFGIQVLLSAHRDIPPEHVALIIHTLVKKRAALSEVAPVYRTIDAGSPPPSASAPLHEGAQLYHLQPPIDPFHPEQ